MDKIKSLIVTGLKLFVLNIIVIIIFGMLTFTLSLFGVALGIENFKTNPVGFVSLLGVILFIAGLVVEAFFAQWLWKWE